MNYKPILFSTEMVEAILEGRKTQTRRILKLKHLDPNDCGAIYPDGSGTGWVAWQPGKGVTAEYTEAIYPGDAGFKCPYGNVGDVLCVREEHYRYGRWKKNGFTESGCQKWKFCPDSLFTEIRYCDNPPLVIEKNSYRGPGWYKRLARFMPKSACGIFLEITDRRVERVQAISEEDAVSEGIESQGVDAGPRVYRDYVVGGWIKSPVSSFRTLWESINGQESWDSNVWVWVISFKRIDKPEGFV